MSTVLLFTCSEYGHANVNLAISYELVLAGVDVHIASFPFLTSRVSSLQELIARHALHSGKPTGTVVFHECKGFPSYSDVLEKRGVRLTNLRHPRGLLGALGSYSKLVTLVPPWSPTEYLAGIENCKEIITTVKPDIVVIDKPFYVAWDACNLLKQKFILVLPNSIKEIAMTVQPYLAFL
ncbi:hypothetical protein JVU11DRAFT_7865 [Chiua virens]|nr:hypothetical protein JVU11DRAFT_7865 [Chiua virens]